MKTLFKREYIKSIRFKFLAVISLILFFSTCILSAVIATNEREMLKLSLVSKGQGMASYIAKLAVEPLIEKDINQLDALVNEASKDEDVIYIVVLDAPGNISTSQYSSINYRSPRYAAILSGLPKDSELPDIIAHVKTNAPVMEISAPVLSGPVVIGKVIIGMSEQELRRRILATMLFVVALNVAAAFAIGAFLFVFSRKLILNPVVELARATTRLAGGDLSTRIDTRATGEMQMLVDSFNRMAEDLGQRTMELIEAQKELVHREKLAVLGKVADSVGHELRNPLGVINNAVYFLQTVLADADETTKEYLGIIKDEIADADRIVSDLLDAVRTKPPHPDRVEIAGLIRQTLGKCKVPSSVTVCLDMPQTLPLVRVDPVHLHQVLWNLITNAVEAMPDGGTLEIRAVEDRQALRISVRDSGSGMTPEQQTRLFQLLFTTKARRIGLGLSVVKNLTQANGGSVEVESAPGKGSVFTVTLPRDGSLPLA